MPASPATRMVAPLPARVASTARSSSPSSRARPTKTSLARATTPASIAHSHPQLVGRREDPTHRRYACRGQKIKRSARCARARRRRRSGRSDTRGERRQRLPRQTRTSRRQQDWTRRAKEVHDDEKTHDDAAFRSAGRCTRVPRLLACRRRFAGRAERQLPGPHRLAQRVLPGGHRERARHVVLRRFHVGRGDLAGRSSNRVGDGARARRAGARVRRDRLRGRPGPDLGRRRRAAAHRERRRARVRRLERRAARDVSAARSRAAERCRGHPGRGLRDRLGLPAAGRDPPARGTARSRRPRRRRSCRSAATCSRPRAST